LDFVGNAVIYSGGTWTTLHSVDPIGALGFTSVSCASPTFCVASDLLGNTLTYNGTSWGPVVATSGFSADGNSYVSCTSSTFCAALSRSGEAMTYNGTNWTSPVEVGIVPMSLSCASSSLCIAVDGSGNAVSFNGTSWSTPVAIDPGHALSSVSCASTDFCVAVDEEGDALIYAGSSWGAPASIGGATDLASVSCTSSSFCVAVNGSGNAVVYRGTGGWGSPVSIDGTTPLTSVSCTSSSFCMAADRAGKTTAYDGTSWNSPVQSDFYGGTITSISCVEASFCVTVDIDNYAFVFAPSTTAISSTTSQPGVGEPISIAVSVSGGATGPGQRTPTGEVNITDGTQTCTASLAGSDGTATGDCSLTEQSVGSFDFVASYGQNADFGGSSSGTNVLAVGKATVKATLKASSAKLTFGREQVETISVNVSPQYVAATPSGTVTVKESSTTLCSKVLLSAKASCKLSTRRLSVGRYRLVASYGGNAEFGGSVSNTTQLTVAKQSTKTTLKLSAAKVTYGNEETETLSVGVSPEFPGLPPTGTVTVQKASANLCAIKLSRGRGSCKLSAKTVGAGSYHLVATYNGNVEFNRSTSVRRTIAVAK
jgi:hypothetical protein